MSADNAIKYREIDGAWYVIEDAIEPYRDNLYYELYGRKCNTLEECLVAAHSKNELYRAEYGIMHDPLRREGVQWPRPIPVSERLPECGGEYVVCERNINRPDDALWSIADFVDGKFSGNDYNGEPRYTLDYVTHWLPLPPKPVADAQPESPSRPPQAEPTHDLRARTDTAGGGQ